jgi:uncharacterized delta-60 repeat protein
MGPNLQKLFFFAIILVVVAKTGSFAQPRIDSSFNYAGHNILISGRTNAFEARKAISTADGGVLAVGSCGNLSDSICVVKLQQNGSVDASFGNNGYSTIYADGFQIGQQGLDIVLQRDKKIVVMAVGQKIMTPYSNTQFSIVLLRLSANGSKDKSFNGNGLTISRPDAGFQFMPLALAIDSTTATDRFYVSSLATENGNANCPLGFGKWCISRYNASGVLDAGFNGTGYQLQSAADIKGGPTTTTMALVLAMKVLSNGTLLAAGVSNRVDSFCFMFRLNANGSWDNSFGTQGRATRAWGRINNYITTSAHILKDGSAVFAAHTDLYNNNVYDSSLLFAVKCNSNGTPATTFGKNGELTSGYVSEGIHQLSSDNNNRLLLTWNVGSTKTQYMHFMCFSSSGIPDASFAPAGHAVVEPISQDALTSATVYHTLWTSDNKNLVVLERRFNTSNATHVGVFRYKLGAGAPTAVSNIVPLNSIVYPVPATDHITVAVPGTHQHVTMFLSNMQGQIVSQVYEIASGSLSVDVSSLARGTYFVQMITASGEKESKKIVLQ